MKKSITIITLLVIAHTALAQDTILTALRHNLLLAHDDTSRVWAMKNFSGYYMGTKPDSALIYGYNALALARKIKFSRGEFEVLELLIITQAGIGNNSKALQLIFQAGKIAEKNNDEYEKATLLLNRGDIYEYSKNYQKALNMYREAKTIFDSIDSLLWSQFAQVSMGKMYLEMHQADLALYHCEAAYKNAIQEKDNWVPQYTLPLLGRVQDALGNTSLALSYFRQTLTNPMDSGQVCACYLAIAQLYQRIEEQDSAIVYGTKLLALARKIGFFKEIIDASVFLSHIYENKDLQQALLYSKNAISYKDSLHNMAESATEENFADLDEKDRQRQLEEAKVELRNRFRIMAFIGIIVSLLVIAIVLFRGSRRKQKAKQTIEKAYDQLKATQSQLIQSEKMASLGELTAGIAHEIQNPLNFVNNFSEINTELIEELEQEADKGNIDEVKAIAADLKENEQKINLHGRRADSIVKGMLQHSRVNNGQKELTNINALADEYLRLSYHGMRAKDKQFNATIKTNFDERIGKVPVVPQDIGRVFLNLYNNALYAVNERQKQHEEGYEPTVWVSTKKGNGTIDITVKDNGMGISKSVQDKIFQPFFTTKPTGQGTGLGLSLSYDIIKAHGGELKAESKEDGGAMFIIGLPVGI